MEMTVTARGLWMERNIPQGVSPLVEWLDERTAVVAGGGNVTLKGIVRGDSGVYGGVLTITAPTFGHIEAALILDEWIYRVIPA